MTIQRRTGIARMGDMRTIYAIRHNPTGKVYVGSSTQVDRRIRGHILNLRRGVHPVEAMQEDYYRFGEDYSFYILERCPKDVQQLIRREYLWMDVLHTRDPERGYNYKDWTNPFDITTLPKYNVQLPNHTNGREKNDD